ncbi:FtsW/RodA/SpoVE family cell cycle protein [uncultured Candidatus Pelagibacter sp.]|uniref:FtsW/RodA/SpoVE family cell cycle protein n=1 Tax=uncultured Candidatus Pelagibacter sp. TaxID=372654 RepID=UPI0026216165|nr:FtsW/RodA/SpoVE family cell cycle protein [uncultured Candidatus Pelagibacter sp.]
MQNNNYLYKFYYQWWKNIDKSILLLISLLFAIGLFFSLVSTSLIASDKLNTNSYFFFFKHLIYIFIGIIIIFIFSSLKTNQLFYYSYFFFFIALISLFLVPIIGVEVKGSKRWIDLFFLPRFQPIELLKPFLIITISSILCSARSSNLYLKYLLSIMIVSVISLLLIMQPDIGQTLLIIFSWAVLIFTSGINIFFLIGLSIFAFVSLAYLIIYVPKFDYIQSRIFSFFNRDTGTHNFQSDKAIESITSGGFFGKGIGEGTLKNRVPEAHTDYIISVISEEFGVVAIILILLLFLIFIHMVFKKINYEKNDKIKLVLIGCVSLILMQATIHIGVNIRLFPTTGMTLPFLSYGGSSIVSISILSGIVLNLTKRKIEN